MTSLQVGVRVRDPTDRVKVHTRPSPVFPVVTCMGPYSDSHTEDSVPGLRPPPLSGAPWTLETFPCVGVRYPDPVTGVSRNQGSDPYRRSRPTSWPQETGVVNSVHVRPVTLGRY